MKKLSIYIFSVLIFIIDHVNAKQFYCNENPSNQYYYSGTVCTLSGITIGDTLIEIRFQQRNYINNLTIVQSRLDDFQSNMFSGFSNINYLSCVNCGLPDISKHSFTGLSNLVSLNISFGTFTMLQKNLFSQTMKLQIFNASNGMIEEINDNAFANLVNLKTLDLSKNKIKKVTKEIFTPLENLVTLRLSYNEIEVLDEGIFVSNNKLDYLSLDHNNIAIIDSDIFDPNSKLTFITLSFNQLTVLNTTNLHAKYIFASNNNITRFTIAEATTYLNLNQNQIHNVTCESDNSQMTNLILSSNALKGLGCITSLKDLKYLDLSFNEIGKLNPNSFAMLTNIETLKLKSSKISNLVFGVFSHQNNLKNLDISYNYLGNVPLNVFLAATNLKTLFIDGNNITEFSYHDLKLAFKSIVTIGVGDNNFNCTFLAEAIKFLNGQDVKTIVSTGEKVIDSHNINGISCKDKSTPVWIKPKTNNTSNADNVISNSNGMYNDEEIRSIIDQIQSLIEAKDVNHDLVTKLSEDFQMMNQRVSEINYSFLENKSEILKLELAVTNNKTNSSNSMIWMLINQLNNITLEKQLLNNRAQVQEINNIRFEMDKLSYKLNEMSTKLSTYISRSSSSGIGDLSNSSNDVSFIKTINIILLTLVVIFCFYKGYKFIKNDFPSIRRYNTQNTVHTSLEMHGN